MLPNEDCTPYRSPRLARTVRPQFVAGAAACAIFRRGECSLKGIAARFARVKERLAFGKSRRRALPRGDQGRWKTWAGRPDTLATLLRASHGRLPELLPIKWGRMAASPFLSLIH